MIEERKAKALVAGGFALFVTGLVVFVLLVIPASRSTQVAEAQEYEDEYMDDYMMDEMMPDMRPDEPEVEPVAPEDIVPPLERSRANPFAPRIAVDVTVDVPDVAPTRYGPDWSQLPIAERVAFVPPDIPTPPTPPAPVIPRAEDVGLRITSILWDATGQAMAAYEDDEGQTGQLRPGDRIRGMTVQEISRTGVKLEDTRTGEVQELRLRPRSE